MDKQKVILVEMNPADAWIDLEDDLVGEAFIRDGLSYKMVDEEAFQQLNEKFQRENNGQLLTNSFIFLQPNFEPVQQF